MTSEYTPAFGELEVGYAERQERLCGTRYFEACAEFERAMAAHDAEVAAKALEDAADDLAKLANITAATSSWMIVDSLRLRAGRLREKP